MKWRRVATSFIEVIKEEKSHIVLFKRSEKVNSYAGRWASISGSIELIKTPPLDKITDCYDYKVGDYYVESPLECALREMVEETQLQVGKQLKMIRCGRPQYLPLSIEKGFIVYPFLFRLIIDNCHSKDITSQLVDLGFQIDWEHDSFKVFDTEQFLRLSEMTTPTLYETVPNLRDTLHRVYFISGPEKQLLLDIDCHIVNNSTDGVTTIALKAVNIMKKALQVFSSELVPDYFKAMNITLVHENDVKALFLFSKLRDIVWILDHCRTEMPMIGNVAVCGFAKMTQDLELDQEEISKVLSQHSFETMVKQMEERLQNFANKLTNNNQIVSTKLQNYLKSDHLKNETQTISILTHSWSSSVIKSLKDLIITFTETYPAITLSIYVTESQPEKEGYKTAQFLKDFITETHSNATVQVCTEACIGFLSRSGKIDLMLVGTDAIQYNSGGNFEISNKTGTNTLYCASRFYKIPFVVLSESMKLSHQISTYDTKTTGSSDSLLFEQPLFEHFTLVNDPKQTILLLEIENVNSLNQIQSHLEIQRLRIFGK